MFYQFKVTTLLGWLCIFLALSSAAGNLLCRSFIAADSGIFLPAASS
ncbi:MAG: hypothetical protein ACJAS0_000339 [Alcanivorax borkumensis]|jgi:hypothetical protein